MVVFDKELSSVDLYEIKHSDSIIKEQARHLNNQDFIDKLAFHYGKVNKKVILYQGKDQILGDIEYRNVEEYLLGK